MARRSAQNRAGARKSYESHARRPVFAALSQLIGHLKGQAALAALVLGLLVSLVALWRGVDTIAVVLVAVPFMGAVLVIHILNLQHEEKLKRLALDKKKLDALAGLEARMKKRTPGRRT